jgi:HTH-type transcriptional regulator/antitoxin HigA
MIKENPMEIKIIRSEQQYEEYLSEVSRLIRQNPSKGTPEADKLELISVLIEEYENKTYPIEAPDPIDAITFRMEEQGLKQADLVPYFGTRSRVSEVLSRKRPLTVHMIRALSIGLGISTDTLIGLNEPIPQKRNDFIDWSRFPVKEMVSRGWINKATSSITKTSEQAVSDFLSQVGFSFETAAYKRSLHGEAYSPTTKYTLYAWLARVIQKGREKRNTLGKFDRSVLSASFLKEIAQLSWFDKGPLLAVEFLEKHGIAVVIEPHLKGSMLDGAALEDEGHPIIGLTIRFDRLDNFWFTLLHEVAHIWKHTENSETFLDDLESSSEDKREVEANRLAKEAFIPRSLWKRSNAYTTPSIENIDKLSRELKIHPAIVAGRLRKDLGNYQLFGEIIGQHEVRKFFNIDFSKDSE